MRVDLLSLQKTYSLPKSSTPIIRNGKMPDSVQSGEGIQVKYSSTTGLSTSKILTNPERQFFVNMFPENTRQIMTHEVFTRNGKVRDFTVQTGSIIDGKI